MKQTIKEVIVVEGKTDTNKLKSIFNVETIETNGSEISLKTLEFIKKINNTKGVILFLDPDGPGEKIRKTIIDFCKSNIKNCFITKNDILNSKKIGIAEATNESIIKALNNVSTFNPSFNSISLKEWNSLNIDNKNKRLIICNYLNISLCNSKQLFKRLNMLGITFKDIDKIISKYEDI